MGRYRIDFAYIEKQPIYNGKLIVGEIQHIETEDEDVTFWDYLDDNDSLEYFEMNLDDVGIDYNGTGIDGMVLGYSKYGAEKMGLEYDKKDINPVLIFWKPKKIE